MMDDKIVEFRKYINKIERASQKAAQKERCPICGGKQTSFCNSHLVPRFILENISNDGRILQSIMLPFDNELVSTEKGVANSGTFHFICRKCDQELFAHYENEDNLVAPPSNLIMAEIALKNYYSLLSKRYKEIEQYNILQKNHRCFKNKELMDEQRRLDIDDYQFSIRRTRKIIEKKLKSGFVLLYWRCLPYVTPIAAQSAITIHRNISGTVVNDVYNFSTEYRMQQLHVCIFPLKEKTAIFCFFHKDDRRYFAFQRQFNRLSPEQQLQYVNYLIFKYTEEYYCNSSLSVLKTSKELVELSRENYDVPDLGYLPHPIFLQEYHPIQYDVIPNVLSEQYKLR